MNPALILMAANHTDCGDPQLLTACGFRGPWGVGFLLCAFRVYVRKNCAEPRKRAHGIAMPDTRSG